MEEDIEILEEMITWDCLLPNKRQTEALENLIKGYRELEKELERQKEINIIINKENLNDKYEEALEKVMTKFLNDNVNNDFIPKSKIKEKMKKYEWALEHYDSDIADYKQSQDIGSWHALQELMEE